MRLSHSNNVILSYINVNSIRNKLGDLSSVVSNNVDVLCIAETKLDGSFPEASFLLNGFKKPFRLDVTSSIGGLLMYVNKNMPCRQLITCSILSDTQVLVVELNLRKRKWLLLSVYRNPLQNIEYFLHNLSLLLEFYPSSYENVIIFGDFNSTTTSVEISSFMSVFALSNLINTFLLSFIGIACDLYDLLVII